MRSIEISNALLRTLFIIIGISISIYLIYTISSVIIYLIGALLLSFIAQPIADFLQKKLRFKPILAISVALSFFIFLSIGILMLFVPLLVTQSQKLSLLDVHTLQKNYLLFIDNVENWLISHNIDYNKYLDVNKITESLNLNFITDIVNSIIGSIGNFGMAMFSIFFIAFFLMKDQGLLNKNLKYILPPKQRWRIIASLLKIKNMLSKYAIGLLLQLVIVFVLYLIVLLLFKVENAFIIAFLGAILNIVPYVGPIIASIMTAFLTMLSNINQDFNTVIIPTTLYVLIGYVIVQMIDNNVSQPIIASKSTNSHPLEIFIIILISGILMGITGMIIAIPLYTSIKVVLKEFYPNNKFIHILTRKL